MQNCDRYKEIEKQIAALATRMSWLEIKSSLLAGWTRPSRGDQTANDTKPVPSLGGLMIILYDDWKPP